MSTPSIQTLITQAQQVLNLKSSNEIRATLAAVLANANVGTPLNPNLTTQQLWDEFYEIVRQPSDDIMSIITDQMMRMVFSPPAPGGAGADKQVIFNDGGVLAGDPDLIFNKALNKLVANNIETAAGLLVGTSATITGALTVDTATLVVDPTNDRVGIGTTTPAYKLEVATGTSGQQALASFRTADTTAANNAGIQIYATPSSTAASRSVLLSLDADGADASGGDYFIIQKLGNSGQVDLTQQSNAAMTFSTNGTERARITASGDVNITTGNVVMSTSGKGIDFSATASGSGTMTSELLNDYEEGTWTPSVF